MSIVTLTDGSSSARIAPQIGFNCFEFIADVPGHSAVSVIASADGFEEGGKPPSHSGIPLLFPFPNRIRAGRFRWDGKDYELPASLVPYEGNGNAIHGFCLDRAWRVTQQSEADVTGTFRISEDAPECLELWPADGEISVRYRLQGPVLRADITVTNPGETPLPWGFGTHAYFRLPLNDENDRSHCLVEAPVSKQWALTDCLPDGRITEIPEDRQLADGAKFSDLTLDDVYTGVQPLNGVVVCKAIDQAVGLQIVQRCDSSFREIVAFTPPWTDAVCLEPYTCVTDAINLHQQGVDSGLRVLQPGETWAGWIEIEACPLEC